MNDKKEHPPTGGLSLDERELLAVLLEDEGIEQLQEQAVTPRASAGAPPPLSFAQQRLWFLHQWQPETALYNIPVAVRLRGRLDIAALEQTLNEVVRRHESLRTTFTLVEGRPVQIIAPVLSLTVPIFDLAALPETEREAEAQRLIAVESQQPFDLVNGPVLRASLLRLAEEEHVVMLTMHHIVSDAWSRSVLIGEVATLYDAFSKGQRSSLPELSIQYADFAVWQREWLQGEVLESQLAYWRQQLTGLSVLELPTDKPRPAMQSSNGAQQLFTLSGELTGKLQSLAQREGMSLFMVLMAAFKILLSRYTGQTDISVGTPIAGRSRAETEGLIGFFINTLVLRTDVSGDPSVRELLGREREVALGAYAHQDVPFEKLVDELQLQRNLSHSPLFQVMLVLQNASRETLELPDVSLSTVGVEITTAKFELTVMFEEREQGLVGSFEYNTDLFEAATIERMIGHFQRLLAGMVANPAQRISALELLGSDERQLLAQWNNTATSYPADRCLHELIEEQVERTPDAVALIFEAQSLTYRQLNDRANQLAHHLRKLGAGAESLVAVQMERSTEMVVALLGILKAGAAYVPFDPSYPAERLNYMLADTGATVLLTQQDFKQSLAAAQILCLDTEWERLSGESTDNPRSEASAQNLAYVIYTSGSTGQPKAAMNSHRAIVNRLLWMQDAYHLTPLDVVLHKTPFSFDVSVWEFFWPLITGARLVLARPGGHQDSAYLVELIQRQRVTTLHFVPSMLQLFLQEPNLECCASLRRVICSGEALGYELQERFFARLKAELHNLYGPTEAAVDVTFWRCERESARRSVPIGRPIANLEMYVLDAQLAPVPVGVAGELYIGGVGVGRGYLGRAELTAERFIPHPYSVVGGERLYRTGDVGRYLANGEIEYLGRIDQQVKVRGYRIELGEIEAALVSESQVREAVVVVVRAEQGEPQLVGYVVAEGGEALSVSGLRSSLEQRLPQYMIPARIIVLEEMPLTANGKVDRRALPAPGFERPELEERYVAPGTLVEEVLANIWGEVLGLERVGTHDNYFALGGDSIRSLQILALAKERGMEFSLQQVFRHQTINELAAELRLGETLPTTHRTEPFQLVSEDDRHRLPAGLDDAYPLTMLQAGMFYHMEMMPETAVYHNVNTWHLRARFELQAFEEAVRYVVARHPVLRTSFDLARYAEPLQLVHSVATLPVRVEDLRHLSTAEQDEVLDAFIKAERENHFDISSPPLLRFFIHLRTNETFQFSLTESHPINDGWSLTSTLAEIFNRYFALLNGENPPHEPPPSATFRDYVMQERLALDSAECQRYWDEQLESSAIMRLPRWPAMYRRNDVSRFYEVPVQISTELTDGLMRVARMAKVPVKSVLLAAHLKVLSTISGQTDVMGGLATNGRAEEAGGDQVRGLFLNTLPFRLQVAGGTWLELVRRTFEAEWELLPYRRYPLIALQRKWNSQPLFETQFNYVHFHALEGVLHSGEVEILPSGVKGIEETHFTLEADFGLDTISSRLYLTTKGDVSQLSVEQVEAAAAYYAETLREMAADPLAQHETNSILSTREREQLLFDWNQTHALYPRESCLHELFEQQAERTPDSVAVIFEDRQLSYRELNQRANQAAHYLRGLGVECETRVALLMERSLEMLVGLLAIQKAGAAYVPLDPAYPHERLTFMLEDAQVEVLLTQKQLSHHLPATVARVVALDADWDLISAGSIDNPSSGVGPENLAYVIYTSGSTGRPKGAMLPHRGIVNCIWGMQDIYKLTKHDRTLFKTLLSFDASVWELFWPLVIGASVVVARPGGHRDTAYLLHTIIEHAVTTVYFVPSLLTVFLEEKMLAEAACVRQVICGGESLAVETVERFYSRLNAELHHSYGPTETSIGSTEWTCERASERQTIPIGRPLSNTQIYLLDRNMQLLPVGTPGEMYIGGDGLARGYLNRPELSAERFVPHPFSTEAGARLYRTGDLTRYLPDGTIEFLGRLDHQVKVRGLRIELGEIEAVLGAHPAIKEAVVMAREDRRGDKRLVAYGRAESSERPTHGEMVGYLREKLPDYMIPAIFVWLEAWPLMTNGKVDRKRLPVPEEARPELETPYVAPRTEIERVIATIWQEVLQVEKVGMHDNFFELGGHSLRLLQVNGKLKEALNSNISIVEMFQYPTINALTAYLSREQEPEEPSAEPDRQERAASRRRLTEQQRQVRKSHRATK